MLIAEINARVSSQTMLPPRVKSSFHNALASGNMVSSVLRPLTFWVIGSMPEIAKHHGVRSDQVLDSLQHYRFGFVQAQRLIDASGSGKFSRMEGENLLLSLFEGVHDIGRMMVGSAATQDMYPENNEGNMLHPIVGAMMLREACSSVTSGIPPMVSGLLKALIATVERHTLSRGLPASALASFGVTQISPWYSSGSHLWLSKADMPQIYKKYAHLIAFADLINNVSEKLSGTDNYCPMVKLEKMDTQQRIDYIIHGPGIGAFKVRKSGETVCIDVTRLWRDGKPLNPQNFNDCLALMRQQAAKFLSAAEISEGVAAFNIGVKEAF
ncbi:MAG: hypothetical protein WC527_05380 [Candidatus Margulisiibacteriota bacterium]